MGSDGLDYGNGLHYQQNKQVMSEQSKAELLNSLYSDHFAREQKRQAIQDQELQRIKNSKVDLTRSKVILANKIASQTYQAYQQISKVKPRKETAIDRICFFRILSKLGYIRTGNDAHENSLSAEAWTLLQDGGKVQLRNLITFFLAVDNIFLEQMGFSPYPPRVKTDKQFGFVVKSVYYFKSEQDVNALSRHYSLFNKNKQLMVEINRQEQATLQQELYADRFVPEINQKSIELAAKNRNEFLTEVSGMDFPMSHRTPQIEDVLLMKGTLSRERLDMEQVKQQNRETEFCSFSPRLNNSSQKSKRKIGKIRS